MTTNQKPFTPADIKRVVKDNRVFVGLVDGKPWITDSYWAAPLTAHLAAFATTYGIDDQPASYMVDNAKTAHKQTGEPPAIDRVVPDAYTTADPATVNGWYELLPYEAGIGTTKPIYVNSDKAAIVMTCEEFTTGVGVGFLRLLGGGWALGNGKDIDGRLTFTVDDGKRYGKADKRRVRVFGQAAKKPMIVVVEHQTTITYQGGKPNETAWTEILRAVLMPVTL